MKRRLWPVILAVGYILLIATLGGLRSDHIFIATLVLLDSYNEKTRLFLKFFFPFILTGVVYDFMRYFYWQGIEGHVRVAEPYYRDLRLFGVPALDGKPGHRVTPNEFFRIHHWMVLDLLCGFAYLTYIAEYLLTAFYLFFRGHLKLLKIFGWVFFAVNFLGFVTYFIYPAAPPWYVAKYGLGPALPHLAPSPAAAVRFDHILGTHFFTHIYEHGVDVYGAYPSLHVTYPFLVTWICFKLKDLHWFRVPALGFYFLVCLSAIYLQHHYVMDVIMGTVYATVTLVVARLLFPALFEVRTERTPEAVLKEAA